MDFPLNVETADGSLQVVVRISRPELDRHGRAMWTCAFGWETASFGQRSVYGATALQALALTLPVLETSLQSEFPGARITMAGEPFVFPEGQVARPPS